MINHLFPNRSINFRENFMTGISKRVQAPKINPISSGVFITSSKK